MIVKINGDIVAEPSNSRNPFSFDYNIIDDIGGFISESKDFLSLLDNIHEHGFFLTIYGKSFFEITKDFLSDFFTELGIFILRNGDFFFLAPAIFLMFTTFIIGKNKYTKLIIPLWMGYFASNFFYRLVMETIEGGF